MLFHTCHFFCGDEEIARKDWYELDPITQLSVNLYKDRLLLVKGVSLSAVNETSGFSGEIQEISPYGPAIYNVFMPGIVGLGCLYLPGKVLGIEQRYCKKFQQRVSSLASPPILFPLSPFEVASRPLLFYVIFNLDGSDLWRTSAVEALLWAHGVGLAMLQQQSHSKKE